MSVEEQFRTKWGLWDGVKSLTNAWDVDLNALLRSFMEECCKIQCPACKEDKQQGFHKLFYDRGLHRWQHVTHPMNVYICKANNIRHHFAWLLEKGKHRPAEIPK